MTDNKRSTVLVVDDAPDNLLLINGILCDRYNVKVATNGATTLRIARSDNPPDLILLDIMMSGMDGYEVCRQLKCDARTCDIPVIFLTARAEVEDEKRGLELGAADYITKPISPPIVMARVRTHLDLKAAADFLRDKNQFLKLAAVKQEQFAKATLDGQSAHICVINAQGTIITTNLAWQAFGEENGAVKEQISIGANYFFACLSPDAQQDPPISEFTSGIHSVLNGTSAQFMKEYSCNSPEKERWFICKADAFSIAGENYAVISHEDITWRKVAERQLRLLSRVIDQNPVAVVIADTEGTIELVNPHFTRSSGYSAEEAIGQNPRILKSGLTQPETYRELWATIKSGQVWEGELINRAKNGDINFEQTRISPIRDGKGTITHYVGINENINKRKKMESSLLKAKEKAEIANRAKDEFLAVMSHEMRTPLNGMIGMTGLLLESDLTDEQRDFAQVANSCGHDLLGIVSTILDYTLVRVNQLNIENADFNLQSFLTETTSRFAPRATEAGLGLTCRIAPSVPCQLNGDAGKVQQILANLVDNAIKFTTKGAVDIAVTCPAVEHGSAIIRFDVHDTGIGIVESRLNDIFSAFSQVDSSATRAQGGLGLGLTLSRELTVLLGGEIGVLSEVGKGSTFWFTVRLELSGETPVCNAEVAAPLQVEETSQRKTKTTATVPRILIAEDNAINQKTALHMLTRLDFQADIAADGLKAVQALEVIDYDLVLMDCMMPEMNGYEATAVIRDASSHVLNHNVPVIAVTANAMEGDREKCLEAGMDDYLTKPLNKKALAEMLAKWLSRTNTSEMDGHTIDS